MRRLGLMLVGTVGLLAQLPACSSLSDDCASTATCGGSGTGASSTGGGGAGGGTGGGTPAGCVPELAGEPVADDCGVFVAAGAGGGAGTKESPVATIAAALATGKSRIYLCAETFAESVALPAGTSIYGGLDCDTDWSWSDSTPSAITGAADSVALTVSGSGSSVVADVAVTAPAATVAGGSSIAALVDGSTVDFVRVALAAGAGMAGDDGDAHLDAQAPNGQIGADGIDEGCPGTAVSGGTGGQSAVCPSGVDSGAGGKGGDGVDAGTGDPGIDGEPTDAVWGLGGNGQGGSPPCTGGEGKTGDPGAVPAIGATGLGALSASGYVAPAAPNGGHGQPGQGGGGGGGVNDSSCGGTGAGPSGGGGGSGGCGGLGGNAGQSGGASIALISLDATVALTASSLDVSDGGGGGDGVVGQQGGTGNFGGDAGGLGACDAGAGGTGGIGAPSGGGLGGHSLGIAYTGPVPSYEPTDVTITIGTAGAGGIGFDDLALGKAGDGDTGVGQESLSFD